jgi:hypothetical protein
VSGVAPLPGARSASKGRVDPLLALRALNTTARYGPHDFRQNTAFFDISAAASSPQPHILPGICRRIPAPRRVGAGVRVGPFPEVFPMADWRKLALSAILADGVIDETEVKVLKKELWADGVIDRDEVKFLIELRNTAQKKAKTGELHPAFERLFFSAIEQNVLEDGKISTKEANWLRTMLFADGKIDANEKKFLTKLKKSATAVSPAFEKLYAECMAK